jgi:polyisoprenoid-binding protein YceI
MAAAARAASAPRAWKDRRLVVVGWCMEFGLSRMPHPRKPFRKSAGWIFRRRNDLAGGLVALTNLRNISFHRLFHHPMKTIALAFFLSAFCAASTSLQAAEVKLSGDNTTVKFVGSKKDGKHEGTFKELAGAFSVDEAVTKLDLAVTLEIESLTTDNPKLTAHLKSPDFFDAKRFPQAKFVSKSVKKEGDGYVVSGELTMHGKTKPLSFPAKVVTTGGTKTVTCEFNLNRKNWDISYNKGGVNDEVQMAIEVKVK